MNARMMKRALHLVTLLAAAGLAAACSGGGSSGGGTAASSPAPSSAAPAAAAHLTDGQGNTLYLFAADHDGQSVCSGECATFWPPLAAGTQVKGATGAPVGTTTRADGSKQVTLAGHPLYRYTGDHSPGQTTGQGLNIEGGLWWMVSPAGAAITTSSAPSSSTDSGGYGGGYTGGGQGY